MSTIIGHRFPPAGRGTPPPAGAPLRKSAVPNSSDSVWQNALIIASLAMMAVILAYLFWNR